MLDNVTDLELIALCKKGNEVAYEKLINRYKGFLINVLKQYPFIHSTEYDYLVLKAMINFKHIVFKYDESLGKFYSYVITILRRNLSSEIKKYKEYLDNIVYCFDDDNNMDSYLTFRENSTPPYIIEETKPVDKSIFKSLEIKILNLIDLGYKYKEVADKLKISVKKVDNTIQKFKKYHTLKK